MSSQYLARIIPRELQSNSTTGRYKHYTYVVKYMYNHNNYASIITAWAIKHADMLKNQ